MVQKQKRVVGLVTAVILLLAIVSETKADTKPLYKISIDRSQTADAERQETGVLNNYDSDKESLAVEGYYQIDHPVINDASRIYQTRTDYTADERGYLAHFKLILDFPSQPGLTLSVNALKSGAG